MKAYELKTHLETLMRETGQGSKEILIIDENGKVFDLEDINYDEDAKCFWLGGNSGLNEEG